MKTVTVRDLRNGFATVSRWLASGETVQVVKRGKPFARLVPEPSGRGFFGAGAGTGSVPADIDSPTDAKWEADR